MPAGGNRSVPDRAINRERVEGRLEGSLAWYLATRFCGEAKAKRSLTHDADVLPVVLSSEGRSTSECPLSLMKWVSTSEFITIFARSYFRFGRISTWLQKQM